jgi:hypothetical protein
MQSYIKHKVKYLFNILTDSLVTEQALLCNTLLFTFKRPTSYLEIGVDQGRTFRKIKSNIKHGVDPYGEYDATYRMTSEMFFALNKRFFHHTYDVIFIDASHFSLIVDKEIEECLRILNKDGYIVLHDTDPKSKEAAEIVENDMIMYLKNLAYPHNKSHSKSLASKAYNGDVWKSIAKIRMEKPTIDVFTIENFCCSVLKKRKQKKLMKKVSQEQLHWNYFIKHRKEILHPIPFNKIQKYYYR